MRDLSLEVPREGRMMNAIEILTEHVETTREAMYAAFDEGRDEEVRGLYEQIKACEAAIDTLRIVGYPELGKVEVTLLGECPFVRYRYYE
jgi:uncharacterized protein Yka (UPF0111/DUF47 family)